MTPPDRSSPAGLGVDRRVEAYVAEHRLPGLAVAVVRRGEPVLARGYGFANLEHSVPASADTLFEIASLTKTFTAFAVLLLGREGALRLPDAIGRHLPGLPLPWRAATIEQLLTHTSGIPNYTDANGYRATTRLDVSRDAVLALAAGLAPAFAPGTGWAYSSTGYYLLGMLIERLSGVGYGEFLRERILAPLEMHDTRVNDPYEVVPRRAAGYDWRDGAFRNKEYYSPAGTFAAGALLSSVAELARWERAFSTDVLLGADQRARIWTVTRAPTPAETANGFVMGLGWYVFARDGGWVMRHNGSIPGFASEMARYSPAGITVALCCNGESAAPLHVLANEIAAMYSSGGSYA